MKTVTLGALLGAGLVIAVMAISSPSTNVYAQPGARSGIAPDGGVIALTGKTTDGHQQLTVIDSRERVMSVYHIDSTSGKISLQSVRNFHWDLRMTEFNGVSPLPDEIRALLQGQ